MTNPIPEIPDRHFNHASSLPSVLLTSQQNPDADGGT